MTIIENEQLKVSILSKGAELNSLYNKQTQLEYLWSGDPAFWGKKSPVLFPIVGTLKEDTYYYQGHPYKLGRHGFARDMNFVVSSAKTDTAVLTLTSSEQTLQNFPFQFRFDIIYRISGNQLETTYSVHNTSDTPMFFSVGGHPAFKLPLTEKTGYTDYYLEFNKKETAGRWPISKDGLLELFTTPLLENTDCLPLNKELFYKDAIVLKHLRSNKVKLCSEISSNGLEFDFAGFPYLGIWAAKNADFICIEPWCGIADSTNSDQDLEKKEGINLLQAGAVFERSWSLTVF